MLSKPLRIALACLLVAGAPQLALAETQQKKKGTKPKITQQVQTGTVSVGLTSDECTALGGKVGSIDICNSGSACVFTDQNQVRHEVCLSKDK